MGADFPPPSHRPVNDTEAQRMQAGKDCATLGALCRFGKRLKTGAAMPNAPYRADQVGSLLRPDWLAAARMQWKRGEIDAAALRATEDRAIREAVARQQAAGLQSITDGEFRRDWWHLDFLSQLDGVTLQDNAGPKFKFAGQAEQPPIATVTGRVACTRPIMAEHFAFLKSVTARALNSTPKMTIPSPSMLHLRGGRAAISTQAYPEMAAFWSDVATAYRVAIAHLADAGCRYLQLDDITFAYLCDPKIQANCRANGDDPAALPRIYADTINAALVGKPADMKVTIHTCRGNFKSAWVAEGGYEPVVEAMFSTNVDGYFMEFDSARAGGFEPLKVLPKGKKVVLGLVTTKLGELESKDGLKRRIAEAARFVPLENLCLSPQCGFSSTHHGNALSQDDQWRKLERVVEVANEVWA
jgi:5-methyltetrahydropteroyltriglutamate--homocysteine methyltransferase